ncbi:MAG: hypothetical protein QOG08_752 [Chloroflexota bacterium]|nr:hypothetical protein [Chloroflexota bacterium]
MDSTSTRESRVLWSFWIACGLSVTGGIAPLLLAAGGPNRIAGVVIPFGVAAVAFGANALMYHQGRPLATGLYFIGSIALVYGMLSMIAVPLRLAVLGTCSSAAGLACPPGSELPLSTGENSGLAIGIAMGTIAILVGFFGLLMLFRIRQQVATPPPTRREMETRVVAPPPAPVAVARIPAAAAEPDANAPAAPEPEPALSAASPNPAVPAPDPTPKPTRKPRAKRVPKVQAELSAPEEPLELPAPEEPLELPASSSPDEPPSSSS